MTKQLPSAADVLFQAATRQRAMPFRSDRLAVRTSCSLEERMIRVFPQAAAAAPHISSKRRESLFPKWCAAGRRETEPLRAPKRRESNHEGWARARRLGCKLRPAAPTDVQFPGAPLSLRRLRGRSQKRVVDTILLAREKGARPRACGNAKKRAPQE